MSQTIILYLKGHSTTFWIMERVEDIAGTTPARVTHLDSDRGWILTLDIVVSLSYCTFRFVLQYGNHDLAYVVNNPIASTSSPFKYMLMLYQQQPNCQIWFWRYFLCLSCQILHLAHSTQVYNFPCKSKFIQQMFSCCWPCAVLGYFCWFILKKMSGCQHTSSWY